MVATNAVHPASAKDRSRSSVVQNQLRILHAIMLHDIKNRFFGNGLGYIVTILWPSAHIALIVGIYYFLGRPMPYGDNRLLYASIGVLPYIIWNYISRLTMIGVTMNRSFLQYPVVKPLDLMVAREALEIISCVIITVGLLIVLHLNGADIVPHRPDQAAFALLSAALLGIGFGILGSVIVMIYPLFNIVYVLVLILCWITSGVAIDPESMPEALGNILSWNPLMHSIEWLRLAYYDDFPARLLDKSYVLYWGIGSLCVGLISERSLRVFTLK